MDAQDGQDLAVDLILGNGVVHGSAGGDTVAIAGGIIAAVGDGVEVMRLARSDTEVIDCGGRAIVPGIVDAHCHLFATAATLGRVDCRPSNAPTIRAVVDALRASDPNTDGWIRGHGYDDSPLGLGRHLDRGDLDAVSLEAPVKVDHRSGHASVLNSAGLRAVGISKNTPDPPGGVIARDDRGEPTGLLLEMATWLRERIAERGDDELAGSRNALRELGQRLLAYGITAVTDAGPDNGPERWRAFAGAVEAGVFPQRVTMMAGHPRLAEMRDAGLQYRDTAGGGLLSLGHAKIMLTMSSGRLHPHPDELSEMVAMAHRMSFPVAIHAVEQDAVVTAALTLIDHPPPVGQDRIEHCGECPPDVTELVAAIGRAGGTQYRISALRRGAVFAHGVRGVAASPLSGRSAGRVGHPGGTGVGRAGGGAEPVGGDGGGGVAAHGPGYLPGRDGTVISGSRAGHAHRKQQHRAGMSG